MALLTALQALISKAWKNKPSEAIRPATGQVREEARLVVGFDFGTSTSKVIVAGKNPTTGEVRRTVLAVDGVTLIPSTVWQRDVRLCFAPSPVGKKCLRSIKTGLNRAMSGKSLPRHIKDATGTPAHILCYGYLSYLAKQTKQHIAMEWPESRYSISELVWSMGAPVGFDGWNDQVGDYTRILQAAIDHPAGLDADHAIHAKQLKNEFLTACGRSADAQCVVLPEALVTISAIVLSSQGRLDPGMYCLADIGAGTTDATWFRYAPDNAEKPMLIYSGASVPIAGDRVNTALFREYPRELPENWKPIPGLVESEKVADLLRDLARVRGDGMCQIGRREPQATFLSQPVNLVLMGGGGNIRRITQALGQPLRSKVDPTVIRAQFSPATHLQPALRSISGATPLHAIALGLSYHPGEHPGFLDRHEITDWVPPTCDGPEFLDHQLMDD